MGRGARVLGDDVTLRSELTDAGVDVDAASVEVEVEPGYEMRRTFAVVAALAESGRTAVARERFPIIVAGNCNSAVGTTAALAQVDLGVVWFDADADFDTAEDIAPASSTFSPFRFSPATHGRRSRARSTG